MPRSSSRQPKRKDRFGDNGEFEGAASSFRSAPQSRKASIDPSVEMGVPAYALPGEHVWAMGLHAGTRKRFKAEVVGLRTQFPRIIVRYIATEDNVKTAIALPEMKTAYLHMGDVKERLTRRQIMAQGGHAVRRPRQAPITSDCIRCCYHRVEHALEAHRALGIMGKVKSRRRFGRLWALSPVSDSEI